MRRRTSRKKEPKTCSVCGGKEGIIYYKAVPPYKCGGCLYFERCPDEKLRAFSERLVRENRGWGKMNSEQFYQDISEFIKVR